MNRPCVSSDERDVESTREIGTRSNPTASVYAFTSTRIVARVFLYLAVWSHGNRYTCFCHCSQPIRVASRFYDRPERSTPTTGHPFRFPFTFASPFRDSERIRSPAVPRNPVERLGREREVDRIAMPDLLQPVQRGLVFRRVRRSSDVFYRAF